MMGENEPNLSIEEALLKKISDKSKGAKSSSNAEGDNKEKITSVDLEQEATPENALPRPNSPSPPTCARSSPDPNCAICLEQLQNKSFTDSCFHMFCFTCLVEWSKVKAECPLCKQRFKSIVHNVRSARDYDQYHIQPKRGENVWNFIYDQRFRYRTTLTAPRQTGYPNEWVNGSNRNNLEYAYHQEIASHRLRYAPHSVHLFSNSNAASRVPCSFRQRIYEQDVWVIPAARGRVRLATPQFYQQNPACTHRLIPWLNRELVALLHNGESHVTFVMELIMALINRYEITGREFFLHVEPYLAHHTSHFIHEFYNFAISPYDMEAYDNHAVYQNFTSPAFDNAISPPDNDVILISLSNSRAKPNQSSSSSTTATTSAFRRGSKISESLRSYRIKKRAYKRIKKLVLKRNSKNNLWESALHSVSASLPSGNGSDCVFTAPGTSASHSFSALLEVAAAAADAAELADHAESSAGNDEDCMIVEEVKPKHERTPEIVYLTSDDEQSNTVQKDFSFGDEAGPSVSPGSEEPISVTLESDSSDIECIYETAAIKETNVDDQPSTSQTREESPVPSTSRDHNNNSTHASPSHYPTTAFNPWSAENEKKTFPFPKLAKFVGRHENPSSSQYASTESYSDSEHPPDRTSEHKKLKLRSVIAHFSIDRESDSSRQRDSGHHSSHKRHKEKKKKKKKHSHKHKHRMYSDSDG